MSPISYFGSLNEIHILYSLFPVDLSSDISLGDSLLIPPKWFFKEFKTFFPDLYEPI